MKIPVDNVCSKSTDSDVAQPVSRFSLDSNFTACLAAFPPDCLFMKSFLPPTRNHKSVPGQKWCLICKRRFDISNFFPALSPANRTGDDLSPDADAYQSTTL